jgi:hypothetical protein
MASEQLGSCSRNNFGGIAMSGTRKSSAVESCPQPETPIRERAWTAEQLLKLADRVETCNRVSVQREAASALRFAAAPLLRAPAEGHEVKILSHDGECWTQAKWEHQEGAYVTHDAIRLRDAPAGQGGKPCTCHPDDNPPRPCPQRYALTECRQAALAQNAQGKGIPHPDDVAVDCFAFAMKEKLAEARAKGRGGWQDKDDCPQQRLSDMLRDHVAKGDPRDVGNFAMFLHQRGESILPAHSEQGDARAEEYAERLARSLWREHYAEDAPQWEPLTGDLMGLLSQIDNMTTGLTHAEPQNAQGEAVAEIGQCWDLRYLGDDSIASIAKRHNLKVGDKLYTRAERARVPDGWVMVPPEITDDMEEAWISGRSFAEGYRRMLAAAPSQTEESK